jgi:hypothetical protein
MDHEQNLRDAEHAASQGDAIEVATCLVYLCNWLSIGGAEPVNMSNRLATMLDTLEQSTSNQ